MNRSAVILDFDGTITKRLLDFDAIRAEMGIERGPILEAVSAMTVEERGRAERILHRHEQDAAEGAQLQPGAGSVLDELRSRGHPLGVVTRNARRWVDVVMQRIDGLVEEPYRFAADSSSDGVRGTSRFV